MGVFLYIGIYTLLYEQAFLAQGSVEGSARLQAMAAHSNYTYNQGAAPYCLGTTAASAAPVPDGAKYTILPGDQYQLDGGVAYAQRACQYADANQVILTWDVAAARSPFAEPSVLSLALGSQSGAAADVNRIAPGGSAWSCAAHLPATPWLALPTSALFFS